MRGGKLPVSPAPLLGEAVAAAEAVLVGAKLAEALSQKLKDARRSREKLTASTVVTVMHASAQKAAKALLDETESLIALLHRHRIRASRTTEEIDGDWPLFTGRRYKAYEKCRRRIRSIPFDLDALHADLIFIARCLGKSTLHQQLQASEAPKTTARTALFATPKKLDEILAHLRGDAADLLRESAK
jgi:hypothetical protein